MFAIKSDMDLKLYGRRIKLKINDDDKKKNKEETRNIARPSKLSIDPR